MLKLFTIKVPSHEWGCTFQKDFAVNSKGKIVGICANIVPDDKKAIIADNTRVGIISVSTNNAETIHSSIPARCLSKSEIKGINKNSVAVDNVEIGSQLRIIIEESNRNPFVEINNGYTLKVYATLK